MPSELNYKNFSEFSGHELVREFKDPGTGVTSYIAIHNTNLGPALGGTRLMSYAKNSEGLRDALKLSKAMTYKCAIAGVPFGGGKAVIMTTPSNKNIWDVLKKHAANVRGLKGLFYTGADVGLNQEFVEYLGQNCPYIIGTKKGAGDPSPYAAVSAFLCAGAALKHLYGRASSSGKTVIIKGAGKTGKKLAELFYTDGAKVLVADINPLAVKSLQQKFPGIKAITVKDVQGGKCDIYSPCALSNDITAANINTIKAKIICGTANNQLAESEVANTLFERGILHIPDYVANAGGLINVANELLPGGYKKQRMEQYLQKLKETVSHILDLSQRKKFNTLKVANALAEQQFLQTKSKVLDAKVSKNA